MAKGWRIWGCVISLCVLWFWIICFWHIGEPSGSDSDNGRRLVRKSDTSVLVLPPALPATPKPQPVMASGPNPIPEPAQGAQRRKPASWSRWTEKVTTTTTSTTLPTTTIATTSTSRHHYTVHYTEKKHSITDDVDWRLAESGKAEGVDAKNFNGERAMEYDANKDYHAHGDEAIDSVYAPLQKDQMGEGKVDPFSDPDTPDSEVEESYNAGDMPELMNDKEKDWHSEVVEDRKTGEYGREEPPDTTTPLAKQKNARRPRNTIHPRKFTQTSTPPVPEVESTSLILVEGVPKKGEPAFIDQSLSEAEEFENKDGKNSYDESGEFAGTSWWDHEEGEVSKAGKGKKDEEVPDVPKGKEARVKKLLERAKSFHSPFFKDLEAAAKDDLILDLMEDPFPVRWAVDGVNHSFAKAVKGSLLDDDHWLMFTMDNKLPPHPKDSKCKFEDDIDYQGLDIDHFEHLTDKACCDKCIEYGDQCQVAVMSAIDDDPPRTCWLKSQISRGGQHRKNGVRACWKPGQSPTMIWEWRRIGDDRVA